MFSYFPQIRDEESTYSIFSRLQFALQPPDLRFMGRMLFDNGYEVGRLNFQSSFDYLCSNLPSKFTPEKFLYNNTIYPIFIPFLSLERQEKSLKYFKGRYPNKINASCIKISTITRMKTYIRVCKECVREDFYNYGEPYYRRQHEIEINRMCYKHKIPLYEYTIFPYTLPRKYDDYYTVLSNSKELIIQEKFTKKFLAIARDINSIFISNLSNCNIDITKSKIANKIAESGYLKSDGTTSCIKLYLDFKKYYTEEFLDYIGYNFNPTNTNTWLKDTITKSNHVTNPIKFLLVIRFLFGNFKNFHKYNNMNRVSTLSNKYANYNSNKSLIIKSDGVSCDLLTKHYKKQILSFIKNNLHCSRVNVCKLNLVAYKYLLKNNKEWLYNTIPPTKIKTDFQKEKQKNNWLNKDELLSQKLLEAINTIKSEKAPYKRLSVRILEKYCGYYGLSKNKNRLPKCSKILDKTCETITDYQKRRINYAINKMNDNNINLTISEVLYNAGLGARTFVKQEILNYVKEKIIECNLINMNKQNNDNI